jgi:hypothetical protein
VNSFGDSAWTNEAGQTDYPAYWSNTTHLNLLGGQNAAYVAFGRSLGYMGNSWLDVHGAGSQRSDPKSGDPAAWPTGHGPQGDAIRIYNYVRCVRGGDVTSTPAGTTGGNRSAAPVDLGEATQPGQQQGPAGAAQNGQPGQQNGQPGQQNGQAGPPSNGQQQGPGGPPPQEAVDACSGQSVDAACQFTSPHGEISGTCRQIQQQLACVPQGGPPPPRQ